jgi:ATP-dependent Zn protease
VAKSLAVYGPENVTSGASSDIMQATRTATAMVKVANFPMNTPAELMLKFCNS